VQLVGHLYIHTFARKNENNLLYFFDIKAQEEMMDDTKIDILSSYQ